MSTSANPFTTAYAEAEVAAWGNPPAATVSDVAFEWCVGQCRIDTPDYLNWAFARRPMRYPVIRVRGKIWMSLPPVEVQSCYVPIRAAHGVVATAGLGLGYVPLRMAAKRTVRRVDVYEIEADVIRWFTEAFKGRPELDKIRIIHGDVRTEFVGKTGFRYHWNRFVR